MRVNLADWKCSAKERKHVNKVLDSGWLTYGPYCKRLESMWSKYHNCAHGVINNSGTSALQLAFRALKEVNGWDSNTEILVPAITFPATINMVIESGLKPVLVDVDMDGMFNIDDTARKITPNTKGICIVHLWGTPYPRKDEMLKLCRKHSLKIVEDSCETISKSVGDWGDVSCFSMYFNHIISAGVGGMACTNNPKLEYIMRSLANHGMKDVHATPKYRRFSFSRIGYSMRVTEMEAALGVAQFEKIDSILHKRKAISAFLRSELERVGVAKRATLIGGTMMFPLVFSEVSGIAVSDMMAALDKDGVETREMLPITNQDCYRDLVGDYQRFPGARWLNNRGIFLPIHPMMNKGHCTHIANSIKKWFKGSNYNF